MQESKNSHTRKVRWYERAIEASMVWKAISKPIDLIPMKSIVTTPWKILSKTAETTNNSRKLRKCTSTRSFTHVCLCAPYSDIFQGSVVPPRRSFSYQRSRSSTTTTTRKETVLVRAPSSRARIMNVEGGRRIFRGKSLTDDVLMRRFVIDEEATMKLRRRNEMEIIRRRSGMRRNKIGPSPLSRMVLAHSPIF